eukprot:SAG11_NODE_1772_length_4273_cov_3.739578_3_plen_187_part_00
MSEWIQPPSRSWLTVGCCTGLSGHLAMFWNDIQHSVWLNGPEDHGDGGLHERGPYWLNGFVPLAYQLKAAGVDVLYPKCGVKKPVGAPLHRRPSLSLAWGASPLIDILLTPPARTTPTATPQRRMRGSRSGRSTRWLRWALSRDATTERCPCYPARGHTLGRACGRANRAVWHYFYFFLRFKKPGR